MHMRTVYKQAVLQRQQRAATCAVNTVMLQSLILGTVNAHRQPQTGTVLYRQAQDAFEAEGGPSAGLYATPCTTTAYTTLVPNTLLFRNICIYQHQRSGSQHPPFSQHLHIPAPKVTWVGRQPASKALKQLGY
jgi:hypothetical protein